MVEAENALPSLPAFPFLHCPPEILAEIFNYYIHLPKNHSDSEVIQPSCFHLPPITLLSNVCGHWRNVSNHIPSLWSTLTFTVGRTYPPIDILTTWLERSGSLPLDITIRDLHKKQIRPMSSRQKKYLDCLLPFCERWRTLHLTMDWLYIKYLFRVHSLYLPLLESLQLETAKIRKDTRLQSLTNAPKLLYFSCISAYLPANAVSLYFPGPQNITTLKIVGISQNLESYYAILRSCPQLSSCTISLPDDFTDFLGTSPEIIKLAHLEELMVEFIGHFGCPDFFDILDLPNLIDLSIRHFPSDDDRSDFLDPFPYLSALFERSDNFLCALNLAFVHFSSAFLIDFLEEVPSLACLSLVHCSLHIPTFCHILSHLDEEWPILPELTSLILLQDPWADEDPEETGIDNASISDLACSRWCQEKKHGLEDNAENSAGGEPGDHDGVERLEFLRVSEELLGGEGENSDRARLEALQQQGMEVVIE